MPSQRRDGRVVTGFQSCVPRPFIGTNIMSWGSTVSGRRSFASATNRRCDNRAEDSARPDSRGRPDSPWGRPGCHHPRPQRSESSRPGSPARPRVVYPPDGRLGCTRRGAGAPHADRHTGHTRSRRGCPPARWRSHPRPSGRPLGDLVRPTFGLLGIRTTLPKPVPWHHPGSHGLGAPRQRGSPNPVPYRTRPIATAPSDRRGRR